MCLANPKRRIHHSSHPNLLPPRPPPTSNAHPCAVALASYRLFNAYAYRESDSLSLSLCLSLLIARSLSAQCGSLLHSTLELAQRQTRSTHRRSKHTLQWVRWRWEGEHNYLQRCVRVCEYVSEDLDSRGCYFLTTMYFKCAIYTLRVRSIFCVRCRSFVCLSINYASKTFLKNSNSVPIPLCPPRKRLVFFWLQLYPKWSLLLIQSLQKKAQ